MRIDLNDIDGIMSCEKCGIVFDINKVKIVKGKNKWDSDKHICPLCKHKNIYIDWRD